MLNSLSSVAVFLFVFLFQKVLPAKTEFGIRASCAKYGTPMISLSVKIHRLPNRKLKISEKTTDLFEELLWY
jgi:hypothetical protein